MVPLDDYERRRKGYTRDGEKWWNVEHSIDYKRTQLKFLNCVTLSGKPLHGPRRTTFMFYYRAFGLVYLV
jgi:hypothetical protein